MRSHPQSPRHGRGHHGDGGEPERAEVARGPPDARAQSHHHHRDREDRALVLDVRGGAEQERGRRQKTRTRAFDPEPEAQDPGREEDGHRHVGVASHHPLGRPRGDRDRERGEQQDGPPVPPAEEVRHRRDEGRDEQPQLCDEQALVAPAGVPQRHGPEHGLEDRIVLVCAAEQLGIAERAGRQVAVVQQHDRLERPVVGGVPRRGQLARVPDLDGEEERDGGSKHHHRPPLRRCTPGRGAGFIATQAAGRGRPRLRGERRTARGRSPRTPGR